MKKSVDFNPEPVILYYMMNTTTNITPKVNDILTSSWGYDQTNVSAYKVVGVTPSCVKLVKIGVDRVGEDKAMPNASIVKGQPFIKKVKTGYSDGRGYCVKIESYEFAYLWDGKPEYITPWGCGH